MVGAGRMGGDIVLVVHRLDERSCRKSSCWLYFETALRVRDPDKRGLHGAFLSGCANLCTRSEMYSNDRNKIARG